MKAQITHVARGMYHVQLISRLEGASIDFRRDVGTAFTQRGAERMARRAIRAEQRRQAWKEDRVTITEDDL